MKRRLIWFLTLLVPLLAWGSLGLASASGDRDDGPNSIPVREIPEFSDIRLQLQTLVNARAVHEVNHFCVIGWPSDKNNPAIANIYWPTQNKIIVWSPGGTYSLIKSITYIDITHDVVKRINPNHYPIILPWTLKDVSILKSDCRDHGNIYTIKRTIGGWLPISKFSQFASVREQLEYLADHKGRRKINKFCVVGQKSGSMVDAFVYWQTEGQLIFWLPSPDDNVAPYDLADAPINIRLDRDLVESYEPSDYHAHMRRSYAAADIRACLKFGEYFVIQKGEWKGVE